MPAARHVRSNSPGRPASATPFTPEALNAFARALGLLGVDVVRPAQADEQHAACFKPRHSLFARCSLALVNCFKTANFKPVAHELNPAAMLRLRPQRGEINFRPRASPSKDGVGQIAQTFERLCEANRRHRALNVRKGLAFRRANCHLDWRLGEIGVGAHAGDRRS